MLIVFRLRPSQLTRTAVTAQEHVVLEVVFAFAFAFDLPSAPTVTAPWGGFSLGGRNTRITTPSERGEVLGPP